MEVEVIGMGVEEETSSTPSGWFQFKLNAHSSIPYILYIAVTLLRLTMAHRSE